MPTIRSAALADARRLLDIYGYYVQNTAITFEYDIPSLAEFHRRIQTTLGRYPYLVVEEKGVILGYAYAGPFNGRAAYDWSCEVSIYLARSVQGQGLGRMLYEALENALRKMGILNLYACIACPRVEDEYLTQNSLRFHTRLGYALVGTFHCCGQKFGRWYDMVWMEKFLGAHQPGQPPIRPYPELCTRETEI